jgi:hypothetical protein
MKYILILLIVINFSCKDEKVKGNIEKIQLKESKWQYSDYFKVGILFGWKLLIKV